MRGSGIWQVKKMMSRLFSLGSRCGAAGGAAAQRWHGGKEATKAPGGADRGYGRGRGRGKGEILIV